MLPSFTVSESNAPAISGICRRLDGMPLAIELAASRIAVLTPRQILSRLDDRFRLLSSGDRAAFSRGWTLEAAEAVCDENAGVQVLETLGQLVDKSIVVVADQGEAEKRYALLETIRQYGLEQLEKAQETRLQRVRHRDWFLGLVEQAEPGLHGRGQLEWFNRLDREMGNIRAAIEWCLSAGDEEKGLRTVGALYWYWHIRSFYVEGLELSERALSIGTQSPSASRTMALTTAALMAWGQRDVSAMDRFGHAGLAMCEMWGDRKHLASSLQIRALTGSNSRTRTTLLERALEIAQEQKDTWNIVNALRLLACVMTGQGRYDNQRELCQQGLDCAGDRRQGQHQLAVARPGLGRVGTR